MEGRNEREIILKFTLIQALKELIAVGRVSELVAKTYAKVLDKKTKNPDEVLTLLKTTNTQLKSGDARYRFKAIKLEINDKKMNEYINDVLGTLNDKDKGVSPAIDHAISTTNSINEARMMAEGMAEIKAKQQTNP